MSLTSDRQSGAPRHKLEEESLLLSVKAAQHLKQEADGAAAGGKLNKNEKQAIITTNCQMVKEQRAGPD